MKRFIICFALVCVLSLGKLYAAEHEYYQVGTVSLNDFEIKDYTLQERYFLDTPGEYILTYQHNQTGAMYTKTITIFEMEQFKATSLFVLDQKNIVTEDVEIVKVLEKDSDSYYIIGNIRNANAGYIAYYEDGIVINEKRIDYLYRISDGCITDEGIIITGEKITNFGKEVVVEAYNHLLSLVKSWGLAGSNDDESYAIYKQFDKIYVVGTTYSLDYDYRCSISGRKVFYCEFDYNDTSNKTIYIYGHNGFNELIGVSFNNQATWIHCYFPSDGGNSEEVFFIAIDHLEHNEYYFDEDDLGLNRTTKLWCFNNCIYTFSYANNYMYINVLENFRFKKQLTPLYVTTFGVPDVNFEPFSSNDTGFMFKVEHTDTYNKTYTRLYKFTSDDYQIFTELEGDNVRAIIEKDDWWEIFFNTQTNNYGKYFRLRCITKDVTNNQMVQTLPSLIINSNEKTLSSNVKLTSNSQYGKYTINYSYDNGLIAFHFKSSTTVNLNTNLVNGSIYDKGITLKFNSKAYLNNQEVNSGSVINDEGVYMLKLIGHNNEETEIVFVIDDLLAQYPLNDLSINQKEIDITSNSNYYLPTFELKNDCKLEEASFELSYLFVLAAIVLGIVLGFLFRKLRLGKTFIFVGAVMIMLMIPSQIRASEYKEVIHENPTPFIASNAQMKVIYDDQAYLQINDNLIALGNGKSNFKITEGSEYQYLSYSLNGNLYLQLINNNELSEPVQVMKSQIVGGYDICYYNEKLYVVTSINEVLDQPLINQIHKRSDLSAINGIIITFDKDLNFIDWKVYGGKFNDWFTNLEVDGDSIYILGRKEPMSGGDFGYAGQKSVVSMIAKLDLDLKIIDYTIINESYFNDLVIFNEKIYLYSHLVYCFDENLDNHYYYEIEDCISSYLNESGILVYSNGNNLKLFSVANAKEIGTLNIEVAEDDYLQGYDDCLLLVGEDKEYYIDVFDVTNFQKYPTQYALPRQGISLYSDILEQTTSALDYLNPQICGDYQFVWNVQTSSKCEYSYQYALTVAKEANVIQGGIYPIGYKLSFTGSGKLDGNIVLNNHQLNIVGPHQLTLTSSNDEVTTIDFTVASMVTTFADDSIIDYQYEVMRGKQISYQFTFPEDYLFDYIVINGKKYLPSKIEDDKITIDLDLATLDYYQYSIDMISYYIDKWLVEEDISKEITYRTIDNAPSIVINSSSSERYQINIVDSDNTLRHYNIIVTENDIDTNYQFPLSDATITLDNFITGNSYKIAVQIGYDLGTKHLQYQTIIEFEMIASDEQLVIGTINHNVVRETIERVDFTINDNFKNNSIRRVMINNQDVYVASEVPVKEIVIISVIVLIVALIISYFVFRKMYLKYHK